jgi:hypothetical protein
MSWTIYRGPSKGPLLAARVCTVPTLGAALYAAVALLPPTFAAFVVVRHDGTQGDALPDAHLLRYAGGGVAVHHLTLGPDVVARAIDDQAMRTILAREVLAATFASAELPPHATAEVRVEGRAGVGWAAWVALDGQLAALSEWLPTEAAAASELAAVIAARWPMKRDARPS